MARKHTPYYHQFMALGAEMLDRIGFDSALRFTSVQGPLQRATLASHSDFDIPGPPLSYSTFPSCTVAGVPDTVISRTGYSGELGFELFYPGEFAHHMYAAMLAAGREHGMEPCGL